MESEEEDVEGSEQDSRKEAETELFRSIYQLCEEAYEQGIDSVDIYRLLHSRELIRRVVQVENRKIVAKSHRWMSLCCAFVSQLAAMLDKLLFHLTLLVVLVISSVFLASYSLDVNPLKHFPALSEKQCLIPAHPLLLEMVRPLENCSVCTTYSKTNSVSIEFLEAPSESQFLQVAYLSRPVLVRRGAFGTGMMPTAFNFRKLRQMFESEPGGVDSVSEECQFLPFRSPFNTLREAFDNIDETAKWDAPWYIGWSNCHPGVAAKLREIFPRPKFLPPDSESSAIDWIFIGSPGLGASMHIDYVRRPSWQVQLSGTKRWILKPPPECEEECTAHVEFTVNPGDMVFLDTNVWFHETQIIGDQLSISIGSEYD